VPELFHITERATWLEAARAGEYRMSTRGITLEEQGFIHCSLRHQLPAVAALVYGDVADDELVVLVIDSEAVLVPIRHEAAKAGGEDFPHIYGALAVSAVTEAVALSRDASGSVSIGGGPISR